MLIAELYGCMVRVRLWKRESIIRFMVFCWGITFYLLYANLCISHTQLMVLLYDKLTTRNDYSVLSCIIEFLISFAFNKSSVKIQHQGEAMSSLFQFRQIQRPKLLALLVLQVLLNF